jgi:hypothetical protein
LQSIPGLTIIAEATDDRDVIELALLHRLDVVLMDVTMQLIRFHRARPGLRTRQRDDRSGTLPAPKEELLQRRSQRLARHGQFQSVNHEIVILRLTTMASSS